MNEHLQEVQQLQQQWRLTEEAHEEERERLEARLGAKVWQEWQE
jgi:hypothetical protein